MLSVLRVTGVVAAVVTTLYVPIVASQSTWELVGLAVSLGSAWGGYLYLCCMNEEALLLPSSLLLCLLAFSAFAENLLTFEQIFRFRISGHLELSPRLIEHAAARAVFRNDSFEQFGSDPLFYRRRPGSVHRGKYDHDDAKPYETVADAAGYLNTDRESYSRRSSIDMFIAGDSVIQGVGMPGVIEEIKSMVPFSVFSLSTGGYSPRQKAEGLRTFGIAKDAKWLVLEFYGGNDASEIIEDEICEKLRRDYLCRFDLPLLASGLSNDPKYAPLGRFENLGGLMQRIREVRSDSLTLAVGAKAALKVRTFLQGLSRGPVRSEEERVLRVGNEAITLPGFAHFEIHVERHVEWIRMGLELTLKAYDNLLRRSQDTAAKVLILYNPTSYEIYRELLPEARANAVADTISNVQREGLRRYATTRKVAFCDLTDGFRRRVREGTRGLFGYYDGTHWSSSGEKTAAQVIVGCFESVGIRTRSRGGSRSSTPSGRAES